MRLALIGYGRMGRTLGALAAERGHDVRTVILGEENREGAALTATRLAGVDVALEFTRPDQAASNLLGLARLGIPAVSGTTGWFERLPEVEDQVRAHHTALVYSPNFSVGVQLFLQAAADLARRFAGHGEYASYILEQHHAAKRDAPSGTAVRLREVLTHADPAGEFPISSVRAGSTPGTHTLAYDSPHEVIRLEHMARGRSAFAAGALQAAEWIQGRTGVFTFGEMLVEVSR
jgi:4-hydroxy-tetrahydrodipicolinate reductase